MMPSFSLPQRRIVPYVAVLSARFRLLLQYRAAAIAGVITQFFWGIMRVMIFRAFIASSDVPSPMSLADTTTYLWLVQAFLLLMPWRIDAEIQRMIRDGTVAYELVRPVDLYSVWYMRNLAGRAAPVLLRSLPMFIIAAPFFGLRPPPTLSAAVLSVLGLCSAFLLSAALTTLMCTTLFWTLAGDGLSRLLATVATVLSGSVVPLPFWPPWAQRVLAALPFAGLMDTPFLLYVGHLTGAAAWAALARQALWIVALILVGRWALRRGMGRVVVQGG